MVVISRLVRGGDKVHTPPHVVVVTGGDATEKANFLGSFQEKWSLKRQSHPPTASAPLLAKGHLRANSFCCLVSMIYRYVKITTHLILQAARIMET